MSLTKGMMFDIELLRDMFDIVLLRDMFDIELLRDMFDIELLRDMFEFVPCLIQCNGLSACKNGVRYTVKKQCILRKPQAHRISSVMKTSIRHRLCFQVVFCAVLVENCVVLCLIGSVIDGCQCGCIFRVRRIHDNDGHVTLSC